MYCVQHWGTRPFNYGEIYFNDKQQAVSFCENIHSGYARVIEKEWVEKEPRLVEFPLKIGLPIIINSRYHRSCRTKAFARILNK